MNLRSVIAMALIATVTTSYAEARDQMQIVGSSTVFPFSTTVAEQFGKTSKFKTPVVESTGSGGGLKLFCEGAGLDTPDIANSSRRIKESEFQTCLQNGVTMTEVKIGYDGIVVANAKGAPLFHLTKAQIFLALAAKVPQDGKLVANPYQRWKQIDPSLPDLAIEVIGPPPTSGTRDAFVELAMEGGCSQVPAALSLGLQAQACHAIREDGRYIEAGENDNLIVQKLEANPSALGVFGFSFLDQNRDKIQGSQVGGVAPTFDDIAAGRYGISRALYFYVKKEHVGKVPGLKQYVAEFTSERAWGPEGYLADKGLIPLPEAERRAMHAQATQLAQLGSL